MKINLRTSITGLFITGAILSPAVANQSIANFASNNTKSQKSSETSMKTFSPVPFYEALVDKELRFAMDENGEDTSNEKVRQTILDEDGFYYTVDEINNWVKYELVEDEGVYIHSIRNSEFNSTIVFKEPWLMIPNGMQEGETYTCVADYILHHKEKDSSDGSLDWKITYDGLTSIKTELETFRDVHKLTSRVEIDLPYKFGLDFDQEHYFAEEKGEVYRTIDGDATFLGFGIKSREVTESLSAVKEISEQEKQQACNRIEKNIEGIELQIALQ